MGAMADSIRYPITNHVTGNNFTLQLVVGAPAAAINVMLDTGSSMMVVSGDLYDVTSDRHATTTRLLQTELFQTGTVLAPVVRTAVGLAATGAAPGITLRNAELAVVRNVAPFQFQKADGILGLAYPTLGTTLQMPTNTWEANYTKDQLTSGQSVANVPPFLDQLSTAGLAAASFAFAVRRSVASAALTDPASDPLNAGVFVLGGGVECTDLFTGAFSSVAVVHSQYYNTNLLEIQVGERIITVPPTPQGGQAASNSFIDSGASDLSLDPALYNQVIAAFNAINPVFASALKIGATAQATLNLPAWPVLKFVLQGSDGAPTSITVTAEDYWQLDSLGAGVATTRLSGVGGPSPGQSVLGLPLIAGHYVVFDRTPGSGLGAVRFAALPPLDGTPMA